MKDPMRKWFVPLVILAGSKSSLSQAADLTELSLEDLLKIEVTTASKKEESIALSTNVVSVITRREIEESGAITLYDLMKRVPGFFPSQQATWSLLTSRGLPSDSNDHFLLLIDGHPQNSIVGQGYQQQDLVPTLDQVERVEIVRGPGSVMWGSSAAMATINVITRDYIATPKLTVQGQSGQRLQYGNLLGGLGDGKDVKGMYSLTVWGAEGYRYKENGENAVAFPWGSPQSDAWFNDWPAFNKQREGFELYSKIKFKDETTVSARILKTSFNYVWDEWNNTIGNPKHELGNRRAYLDIKRTFRVSPVVSIEANVYGDYNLQNRDPLEIRNPDYKTLIQDQTNEEFAIGTELLSTLNLFEGNTLKIGQRYVRTVVGPNRDARLDPTINIPIDTGSGTTTTNTTFNYTLPYFGIEPGVDHAAAVYAEDSQTIGPVTVFVGGRVDWNNYRERGYQILPRTGVIYSLTPELVGKYTYNTGYLRPNAVSSKTVGVIVDPSRGGAFDMTRVSQSESVQSHDLQFSYTGRKHYAALTFFYMNVDNFISFDANNNPQGYKNIGNANTQGIELESKHSLTDSIFVYENVSYAKGKIENPAHRGALTDDEGATLNYPQLITNLGINLSLLKGHTLNLNQRLWTEMRYIKGRDEALSTPTYGTLGPRVYVDLNYRIVDLLPRLDTNIFAFNVFDNQEKIGMVVNNGTYRPVGRTLGVKLSYNF